MSSSNINKHGWIDGLMDDLHGWMKAHYHL